MNNLSIFYDVVVFTVLSYLVIVMIHLMGEKKNCGLLSVIVISLIGIIVIAWCIN